MPPKEPSRRLADRLDSNFIARVGGPEIRRQQLQVQRNRPA